MNFQEKYFNFIDQIDFPESLPRGVEILNPFKVTETYQLSKSFYQKYYSDSNPRLFLIGINPGRFGAGILLPRFCLAALSYLVEFRFLAGVLLFRTAHPSCLSNKTIGSI